MRIVLILLVMLNLAMANSKIALLIGNKDYDKSNLQLQNPINDIEAIGETLEGIGFDVELLKNGTKREMEDELDDFYHRAIGAGKLCLSRDISTYIKHVLTFRYNSHNYYRGRPRCLSMKEKYVRRQCRFDSKFR